MSPDQQHATEEVFQITQTVSAEMFAPDLGLYLISLHFAGMQGEGT